MPAPHLCLGILSCLYWSFVNSSLEHPPLSLPPQQMAFLLLTTQAGKLGITPLSPSQSHCQEQLCLQNT